MVDRLVRTAAFDFLARARRVHADGILPYELLLAGFTFNGQRVPLLGPQGIFKPRVLREMPLSITTAPEVEGKERPYDDEVAPDGVIRYRYRGTDPSHHENVGLRLAMKRAAPLVYLVGVAKGWYMPSWPVYVVADEPGRLTFAVVVDDASEVGDHLFDGVTGEATDARRRYVTKEVKHRLHQEGFRWRVLDAYSRRCAICRLRHVELLTAAHILPDGHPRGVPIVRNGLSLCDLHHKAFDRNLIGVRPDLVVEVRRDLLDEQDGPMLVHGIQGFHGQEIKVPRRADQRPERDRLEERYEEFRRSA